MKQNLTWNLALSIICLLFHFNGDTVEKTNLLHCSALLFGSSVSLLKRNRREDRINITFHFLFYTVGFR